MFVPSKLKKPRIGKAKYFDSSCQYAKREKRKLERTLRRDPSEANKEAFSQHLDFYRKLRSDKRNSFSTNLFKNGTSKLRFSSLEKLLKHQSSSFPMNRSSVGLADDFVNHFHQKVRNVIESIDVSEFSVPTVYKEAEPGVILLLLMKKQ